MRPFRMSCWMVGIRPIYQITCVQKLFPHIKGGAKVADSNLNAIPKRSFFQAWPPFPRGDSEIH